MESVGWMNGVLKRSMFLPSFFLPTKFHNLRREIRQELERVIVEQRRQLKIAEDLPHNLSSTGLQELRQRDLLLRDLCVRAIQLKRECSIAVHQAMVSIMSGQQQLRDITAQHSSMGE